MSFEKTDAMAREHDSLREKLKAQLSQIDGLKKQITEHVAGTANPEVIDIGQGDDVVENELTNGREALQGFLKAIEEKRRLQSDLAKAQARKKNRNIIVGVGLVIGLIVLFGLAAG